MWSVDLADWQTSQRQLPDGAVESEQRVTLSAPAVEFNDAGATALGERYWREVERATYGLVHVCRSAVGVRLRLLGRGPVLLSFDRPTLEADAHRVHCSFPISGGHLARRAAGELTFAQVNGERVELRSAIRGFYPALGSRGQARLDRRALQLRAEQDPRGDQPPLLREPRSRRAGMKVAVFGATGTIGTALLPLLAREHEVVAISRKPREGEAGIEWRQADASDAASVRGALEGVDVAYYLVHSLGTSDFEERDLRGGEHDRRGSRARGATPDSSISAGSARTSTIFRRTCAAESRPAAAWSPARCR